LARVIGEKLERKFKTFYHSSCSNAGETKLCDTLPQPEPVLIKSDFITKMNTNAKRILIETDRRETVVVRASSPSVVIAHCKGCAIETEMLDLNSAVTRSGCGARELIHDIDTGSVHSSQTPSGYLLICANSLDVRNR
jgi:hypothetical protein